jgi:outer membrane receptor protein involved in Fe transport
VAESFLFLLQNGQNIATGDPRLAPEKRFQMDVGLSWDRPKWRGKVNGFYAWVHDYITFENMGVFFGPPAGQIEQVSLKYVNTELAVISGLEFYGEYDLQPEITLFGSASYTHADDLTRNGEFATQPGSSGSPSARVAGLPRGFFSGIAGGATEPLPSILPFDARAGVRWHSAEELPIWGLEFYARMVDGQTRVAPSLLESATPGFSTYHINGFWRHSDSLTFWFGAHNFTNTHYREHLDFRSPSGNSVFQPGASFFVASELTY